MSKTSLSQEFLHIILANPRYMENFYTQDSRVGANCLWFQGDYHTFPWCWSTEQSSFCTWKESIRGNICQVCLINLCSLGQLLYRLEPSDERVSVEESRNSAGIQLFIKELCQRKFDHKRLKAFVKFLEIMIEGIVDMMWIICDDDCFVFNYNKKRGKSNLWVEIEIFKEKQFLQLLLLLLLLRFYLAFKIARFGYAWFGVWV